MARKKKSRVSNASVALKRSEPQAVVAYSDALAPAVIDLIDNTVSNGVEGLAALCSQLVGDDGRFVLVSMIANQPVDVIKSCDPDLKDFRAAMRKSLRSNPSALIKLIGRVKQSLTLSDTIEDPAQKEAFQQVSTQLKTLFNL